MTKIDLNRNSGFDPPLAELWRGGGELPVEPLISRLRRQNDTLRRLNQIQFAVCVAALALVILLEYFGDQATRGLLSLISLLFVVWGWLKYRRDRARLIAAYMEEPGKLLSFLIGRTRAARNLGRYYYLVSLAGVGVGYLVAMWIGPDRSDEPSTATPMLIIVISLGVLVALTVFGLRLARQKSRELRELQAMQAKLLGE